MVHHSHTQFFFSSSAAAPATKHNRLEIFQRKKNNNNVFYKVFNELIGLLSFSERRRKGGWNG